MKKYKKQIEKIKNIRISSKKRFQSLQNSNDKNRPSSINIIETLDAEVDIKENKKQKYINKNMNRFLRIVLRA